MKIKRASKFNELWNSVSILQLRKWSILDLILHLYIWTWSQVNPALFRHWEQVKLIIPPGNSSGRHNLVDVSLRQGTIFLLEFPFFSHPCHRSRHYFSTVSTQCLQSIPSSSKDLLRTLTKNLCYCLSVSLVSLLACKLFFPIPRYMNIFLSKVIRSSYFFQCNLLS